MKKNQLLISVLFLIISICSFGQNNSNNTIDQYIQTHSQKLPSKSKGTVDKGSYGN